MTQLRLFTPDFDVVIIGAGPAGLFCAEQLIDSGIKADRICVLDAGRSLANRRCLSGAADVSESLHCISSDYCGSSCDVLHGEGGPGLYVDCKLCIDADAGAKSVLKKVESYATLVEKLDRRAYEILRQVQFEAQRQDPGPRNIEFYRHYFDRFGLSYHAYPVRTLGTDGAHRLAAQLSSMLESKGVKIRYEHRLFDLKPGGDVFHVNVKREDSGYLTYTAKLVVLAMGRAGASLVEELAHRYALTMFPNPLDIGVRLEFPFWAGVDLLATGANPKIKAFQSAGQYAKTHCFCHGGEVISYRYQGIHLVDGHAYHGHPGRNSNINLLYRYRFQDSVDPVEVFRHLMGAINESSDGKIIAQRLGEFMGTPVNGTEIEPTLAPDRFVWSDLHKLLPSQVTTAIHQLVVRLGNAIPGMSDPGNIIYAPVAEWTMKRLKISSTMESEIPRLFVVGDCAGVSQGVLAAAASGTIAGAAIGAI